jgi:ligand-binding sensor domain-containing protein
VIVMKKHLVLFLFYLLTPTISWCQDIYYENITLESGLPNESVYDVFKDSKGYIWLATNLGLLRFDGTNYVSFQNDSGLSISGSYIKEAYDGSIWYQSFDGYIFCVKHNELIPYKPEKPSGFKPYALQDSILVRTSLSGLEKFDLYTGKKTTLHFSSTLNFCHLINQTIVTGNSKLYFIDVATNKIKKRIELDTYFNSFFSVANEKTIAIADKSLKKTPIFLLNEHGIYKRGYLQLEETIQNIYLFEKEIWCFTKEGIQVFDYDFNPIPEKKILHKKNTSSFAKDKNNFLWIGSPTNGIYLIKDLNSKEVVIENDEFSAISQKNGLLYCGTNKGIIYQYDEHLKNKMHFDTQDKNYILFMDFNSYSQFNFFTSNNFYIQNLTNPSTYKDYPSVKDIAKIDDKTVALAATNFAGKFTLEDFKTENILYERAFLQNIRAKSIAYDTLSSTYYIATNIGLYKRKNAKNYLITHNNKPLF